MKKRTKKKFRRKIAQGILLIVLITLTIFMMSDVKRFKEMHVLLIMQELLEGPHKEKLN